MKVFLSLIITATTFFLTAFILVAIGVVRDDVITLIAIMTGSTVLILSLKLIKVETGAAMASDALGLLKDAQETIESNIEGKLAEFYAIVEQECDEGQIDRGLWSHALVKAKGDENLRKVEYMKLRASQLTINR